MSTEAYSPHSAPAMIAIPHPSAVASDDPALLGSPIVMKATPAPPADREDRDRDHERFPSIAWVPRFASPPGPDHRSRYNGWCDPSIPEELPEGESLGYGWRPRILPDGSEEFVEVELTVEDLLNPQMDDHPLLTHSHSLNAHRLFSALRLRLRDDPSKTVLFDYGLRLPTGVDCCPDLCVISDLPPGLDLQHRLDLSELGARCLLAVEVASVSTRDVLRNDTVRKVERYGDARIPEYVIMLPRGQTPEGTRRYRLLGYRLVNGDYRRMVPNHRGRLWLQTVRLWIGIKPGEHTEIASLYEMGTGEELRDHLADIALAEVERQRANTAEQFAAEERRQKEAERQRAEAAEQAAAEERRQKEAERQRAEAAEQAAAEERWQKEAERQRAEAAEQAAAEERERNEALEAKIRELMAALG